MGYDYEVDVEGTEELEEIYEGALSERNYRLARGLNHELYEIAWGGRKDLLEDRDAVMGSEIIPRKELIKINRGINEFENILGELAEEGKNIVFILGEASGGDYD